MKNKSTHKGLEKDEKKSLPRWVVMEGKSNPQDLFYEVSHCDNVTLEQHEKEYTDCNMNQYNKNQELPQIRDTKDYSGSIMSTARGENVVIRSSMCIDGSRETTQDRHKGTGVTTCSEAEPFDLPHLRRDLVDPQRHYKYLVAWQLANALADWESDKIIHYFKDIEEKGVINSDTEKLIKEYNILITEGDYPDIRHKQIEIADDMKGTTDEVYSKVCCKSVSTSSNQVDGTGLECQYGRRTVKSRGVATDERRKI